MLIGARTAAWCGEKLPYDAEVEYLEAPRASTYACWIDTLIPNQVGIGIEVFGWCQDLYDNGNVSLVGSVGVKCIAVHDDYIGGAYNGSSPKIMGYIERPMKTPNNVYYYCQVSSSSVGRYILKEAGTTLIDKTTETTLTPQINPVNLLLFKDKNNTYPKQGRSRIYYAKVFMYENTVRDFIPVRVGNVGYMYDRVLGQLFGNSGTGAFIIGPDKT